MKILLTGGAGYIGSACLRWLIKKGHDAIAYDDLSEGNRESVPRERLVEGDILDTSRLEKTLRDHGSQAVIHLAALASVPESITKPDLYWRINVLGTKSVLDAMRGAGVQRIVLSSTCATYGFRTEMPIREDAPQAPGVPYGTTKLASEWMIKEYGKAFDIGFALLRYFNAAGADSDGKHGECRSHETHLIPILFEAALGRRPELQVYGDDYDTPDGTCIRDYIHVEDLAEAHLLAVESLVPGKGAAYNLGSGNGNSIREVISACEKVMGRPVPHRIAPRRPGDPPILIAGPEKIQSELGWKPRYPHIEEIVETAWRWHHSHPKGYPSRGKK